MNNPNQVVNVNLNKDLNQVKTVNDFFFPLDSEPYYDPLPIKKTLTIIYTIAATTFFQQDAHDKHRLKRLDVEPIKYSFIDDPKFRLQMERSTEHALQVFANTPATHFSRTKELLTR